MARDVIRYQRYTVQDGLSHRMISGLAQDSIGNIWLSTWNGLCKFDGETFTTYNETSTDEKVGRLALVRLTTEGRIWVIRQSDAQEYLFNTDTELLEPIESGSVKQLPVSRLPKDNVPDSTGLILTHDSIRFCIPYEGAGMTNNSHFNSFIDKQGNIWANFDDALYQITFDKATYDHIDLIDEHQCGEARYGDEIRAMIQLQDGGFVIGCKNNCIYKYNENWQFEGYINSKGEITTQKSTFCSRSIYCMIQADDGSLWLGSRGEGLYRICNARLDQRIKQRGDATSVQNYREDLLGSNHIFDLASLNKQELLVATWEGGVLLLHVGADGDIRLIHKNTKIRKVRHIKVIEPNLIALCSTQGIFLVDRELNELKQLGTMDISNLVQGIGGKYYVSSLSSGVFTFDLNPDWSQATLDSLKLEELDIKEIDNVIISIAKTRDGSLWFISDNRVFKYNPTQNTTQVIDRLAIGTEVIFGEAQPLILDNYLILGTNVGRMHIDLAKPEGYRPELVSDTQDTIETEWRKEIPEIRFTALDFRLPRLVQYAWRELPDSIWNPLGSNGTLLLSNLSPGTHTIEVRSTDAKEIWADNTRTVTIIVNLTIWQKVAMAFLCILIILLLYFGWKAGRQSRTKKVQQSPITSGIQPTQPVVIERNQQFIEQVTKIVEEHIDDPKLDVEMMTNYMNTSRTILYAKFKEVLDSTPASFITEIRLKRAVQLLESHQYRISEIAIMCGFSDPKYFTRHFKQRIGMTPAKYLESKSNNETQE